eukprot:3848064-Karenia_brevis.AAC.1
MDDDTKDMSSQSGQAQSSTLIATDSRDHGVYESAADDNQGKGKSVRIKFGNNVFDWPLGQEFVHLSEESRRAAYEELKSKTKCIICGRTGHWYSECKFRPRAREGGEVSAADSSRA